MARYRSPARKSSWHSVGRAEYNRFPRWRLNPGSGIGISCWPGVSSACSHRAAAASGGELIVPPLSVKVIAYAPTVFRHCQHCEVAFEGVGLGERIHRAEAADALPDDLAADFQRVSDWVHALLERHPGGVAVSVIDAASIEGVWAALRHRIRRFPAVVVEGAGTETDLAAADGIIDARLGTSTAVAAAPGGKGGRKEGDSATAR